MTIKQAVEFLKSSGHVVAKVKGGYQFNGQTMHWQLLVCHAENLQKGFAI